MSEMDLLRYTADEILQRAEALTSRERQFLERKLLGDDRTDLFTSAWKRRGDFD